MKKELIVGLIFLLMVAVSIVNIIRIDAFSSDMISLIQSADHASSLFDWENAAVYAEKATNLWNSKESYTHITIDHGNTDAISDSLYELLAEIYSQDSGHVHGMAMQLAARLTSLSEMEKPHWGSIF